MAGITDQLNGIKDIKSNKLENSYIEWLRSLTSRMNAEQIEYVKLKSSSQLVYKVSAAVLITVFIFISVKFFMLRASNFC